MTPRPWASGHALLKSSACWAHGCVLTRGLPWPGHCWVGRGSDGTGVGSDGGAGRDGCAGGRGERLGDGLADGLGDGLAAAAPGDCAADRAAATAGAGIAAMSATPSITTAIRLIGAASVD
jgi:hypothetical protein